MRDQQSVLNAVEIFDQQHELVAAESSQRITSANHFLQFPGNHPQQAIAEMMAQRIINVLEVIQIDE